MAATAAAPHQQQHPPPQPAAAEAPAAPVKRKRGRPPKNRDGAAAAPAPPKPVKKNDEEEVVCFICFDGGSLVVCDRRYVPDFSGSAAHCGFSIGSFSCILRAPMRLDRVFDLAILVFCELLAPDLKLVFCLWLQGLQQGVPSCVHQARRVLLPPTWQVELWYVLVILVFCMGNDYSYF
jgi:hypothetical protein